MNVIALILISFLVGCISANASNNSLKKELLRLYPSLADRQEDINIEIVSNDGRYASIKVRGKEINAEICGNVYAEVEYKMSGQSIFLIKEGSTVGYEVNLHGCETTSPKGYFFDMQKEVIAKLLHEIRSIKCERNVKVDGVRVMSFENNKYRAYFVNDLKNGLWLEAEIELYNNRASVICERPLHEFN